MQKVICKEAFKCNHSAKCDIAKIHDGETKITYCSLGYINIHIVPAFIVPENEIKYPLLAFVGRRTPEMGLCRVYSINYEDQTVRVSNSVVSTVVPLKNVFFGSNPFYDKVLIDSPILNHKLKPIKQ